MAPKGKRYDLYYYDTVAALVADNANLELQDNAAVFIRDVKEIYYLDDGQLGDNVAHWIPVASDIAQFPEFSGTATYLVGETAKVGASMYICIVDTAAGESPSTNPEKWLALGGGNDGAFVAFTGVDVVTVNHTVNNPTVETYVDRAGELIKATAHVEYVNATQFVVNFANSETGRIHYK